MKSSKQNHGDIRQTVLSGEHHLTLLVTEDKTEVIVVSNEHGEQLLELMPPSGFVFSYLTTDHQGKVSVICSTEEYESSGCDWFFCIDIEKKMLFKKGLSY
ncbi:hypothetical protein [uncultured Shewanella sp.]|uniref:hypothetical protein n=1 Tax=uncultured Shewanella sp. TaxID=173975 RepID=UPI0026396EEC|nr:hypothetical protein [uncultured Shewanella sp.]